MENNEVWKYLIEFKNSTKYKYELSINRRVRRTRLSNGDIKYINEDNRGRLVIVDPVAGSSYAPMNEWMDVYFGDKTKYVEDLPGEIWKLIDVIESRNRLLYISNLGRCKSIKKNKTLPIIESIITGDKLRGQDNAEFFYNMYWSTAKPDILSDLEYTPEQFVFQSLPVYKSDTDVEWMWIYEETDNGRLDMAIYRSYDGSLRLGLINNIKSAVDGDLYGQVSQFDFYELFHKINHNINLIYQKINKYKLL